MPHQEQFVTIPRAGRRDWLQSIRSLILGPFNAKDREIARYFGATSVASGVAVNEDTALNCAAVWNAVHLIASDVAKLPLPLYKVSADGRKDRYRSHPLYRLMHDEPNSEMSSFVFRRTLQAHVLVWGNAYAEIERDGGGRPVALWPLMPYSVRPLWDSGRVRYEVAQPNGGRLTFAGQDMLHLSGLGPDGVEGWTLIRKARESIGLGLATERFGATWFGNGSTMSGLITWPNGAVPNDAVRKSYLEALEQRHQGVDKAHRMLALFDGADFKPFSIPNEASQFLETRRFQIEEVARWFNLPVHKLKNLDRSTNNNIEHQALEYVTDTLTPWLSLWEGELNRKLIARLESNQQRFEHITEGLLRGDQVGRGEFYGKLFAIGAITPNEIRSRENLNPIPGGDTAYVPFQSIPSTMVTDYWGAQIQKASADPTPDLNRKIGELTAEVASLTTRLAAAEEARDALDGRAGELQRSLAETFAALNRKTDDHAAADANVSRLNDKISRLEADYASAVSALADAQERLRHESEVSEARARELVECRTDRDAVSSRAESSALEADRMIAGLRHEVTRLHALLADSHGSLTAASAERDAARALADEQAGLVAEGLAALEAMRAESESVVAGLRQDMAGATEALAGAEHACAVLRDERDEALLWGDAQARRVDEVMANAKSSETLLQAQYARSEADLSAAARELAIRHEQWEDSQRHGDELQRMLSDVTARLERSESEKGQAQNELAEMRRDVLAATANEQSMRTERDLLSQDIDTLEARVAAVSQRLEAEQQAWWAQKAQMQHAIRGLLVDTLGRLLQREADRVRKAQATPEKMRHWATQFYPVHADVCRSALRPIAAALVAVQDGDAVAMLTDWVERHIAESQVAIAQVADVEDADERSASLERTLRRWETERPSDMAEAFIKGSQHG